MKYKYTIRPSGIKLDLDSCPPSLGYKLFPAADWRSVTVNSEGYYEFFFETKQEPQFKSEFIDIIEEQL